MSPELAAAVARLQGALETLDASVGRYFDVDARKSDLETELGVMEDDRTRLATELESATARLRRVEGAAEHVEARVGRAIATISEIIASAEMGTDAPDTSPAAAAS